MAERVAPAKRLCCRPGYNPACRQGSGPGGVLWRRGVRSGRVGEWKTANPSVVARHRGRGRVAEAGRFQRVEELPEDPEPVQRRIVYWLALEKREGDLCIPFKAGGEERN
ncbi:zinc finger SWIM domain-containing protein 6 [Lates japonicus]|uniref:Zinc finger SWIM domain-containing protein 6 n=1 Tax=Lates japonicus TaxID=270547 RepID=A0AAD3NMU8_LATJO|nr:zinc finger SWIM domain-containing protein 6 [Lates japonicus]